METIKENIEGRIIPLLEKAGMYYRVFSRVKSKESIQKKLDIKANAYRRSGSPEKVCGLSIQSC